MKRLEEDPSVHGASQAHWFEEATTISPCNVQKSQKDFNVPHILKLNRKLRNENGTSNTPRISFEVLLSVLTSKIFGKKKNNQRDHSYNLNTVFIIPMEKCDKNVNSQQEEIFFIIFPNKDLFSRSKGAISPLCNCSDSFSIVKLTFLCKEKIPPQMHAVVWHVKSEAWKVTY